MHLDILFVKGNGRRMSKLIELKGVSKSFDGERVLDGIDLYIRN